MNTQSASHTQNTLRVGLVGAGYISDYHMQAVGRDDKAAVVAICDMNQHAAKRLAGDDEYIALYDDFEAMLAAERLDVVHVLTQPDSHYVLAEMAIKASCHVVLEKPATTDLAQAQALLELADAHGVSVTVNHNFLFSRPFNKLQAVLDAGDLGPIKSVRVVWKKILPQVSHGPWHVWMLKAPTNILYEVGSHVVSELLSVCAEPKIEKVSVASPIDLPSGSRFYRQWRIAGVAQNAALQIDMSFDQGYEQHFIEVEGLFAVARADIENDVFTLQRHSGKEIDVERMAVNARVAVAGFSQAIRTYGSYAASKFSATFLGAPYEASMLNGIANCYAVLRAKDDNNTVRQQSTLAFASSVAQTVEAIKAKLPKSKDTPVTEVPSLLGKTSQRAPTVLVIGASGFIGKRLVTDLQTADYAVRALVRNPSSLATIPLGDNVEIMQGDYRDDAVMVEALNGIDTVIHLAVAHASDYQGYMNNDVLPTQRLVKKCQAFGVKRFIFTGTIDSLYLGPNAGRVMPDGGVDPQIKRRNNYARSKATSEAFLNDLYRREQFPVVIIRPAIVLGAGGPVTHLGVANWFGLGRCKYWGRGDHALPMVLVEDVSAGIIAAMTAEGIEGKTYNLSSEPMLSARDYVTEIERHLGCSIQADSATPYGYLAMDWIKWVAKKITGHPDAERVPSLRDWRCREQHASFDTTAAQQDLQWQPTSEREKLVQRGIYQPLDEFLS